MNFLDDVFYGNYSPQNEQNFKPDLQGNLLKAECELEKLLNEEEKKLFQSFVDFSLKLNSETALENFKIGFKLACKLVFEGLK